MMFPRRLASALALAGALVGLGGLTQTADARTAANGAWYQALESCDYGYHTVKSELVVRPQPGLSGQWVEVRAYVADVGTGGSQTTNWSVRWVTTGPAPYDGGGYVNTGVATTRVWHQVKWWNGYAWTADTGWVEDFYTSAYRGFVYGADTACRT